MSMSRIQQILAKAERDGTARRAAAGGDAAVADRVPDVPAFTRAGRREFGAAPAPVVEPPHVEPVDRLGDEPGTAEATPQPVDGRPLLDAVLDPLLVAALDPLSPAAEQYRSLRTRIGQVESGQAIRVIQVTSPGKHDGKTLTSLNLALTMAQEFQRRVLVIDGDLRTPRVHECLGLPPGPGLVDVLTGSAALEEALVEIPDHRLTVLRAGRACERPAEMLGSAPMRRLVDTFRTQFDRVVIDSSPALVSDPVAVASLVDRVLLVVRAGVTTRPSIARTIGAFGPSKLLGLVFNDSAEPQAQYRRGA
jgi:capsular exopolysaccharide synthesis family protein